MRHRFVAALTASASFAMLLTSVHISLADVIDGAWCRADGKRMKIRGPEIVTPRRAATIPVTAFRTSFQQEKQARAKTSRSFFSPSTWPMRDKAPTPHRSAAGRSLPFTETDTYEEAISRLSA